MIPFALFSMFALLPLLLGGDDAVMEDEEPVVEDNPDIIPVTDVIDDDPVDEPGEDPVPVVSGSELTLADVYDPATGETAPLIAGTKGDDVFDFSAPDPDSYPDLADSEISMGDGDDTLVVSGDNLTLNGGAGDDTLDYDGGHYGFIYGGEGNDSITLNVLNGDGVYAYGGKGDDFIDGNATDNSGLYGGEGNDTILISGGDQGGNAYAMRSNGDAGDDIMRFDREASPFSEGDYAIEPQTTNGGEGADRFELRFHEGEIADVYLDEMEPEPGEDALTHELITLGDFEPGVDTIEIEAYSRDEDYEIAEARLEEDSDAGTTQLIVTYEHPTEYDRDVVVNINAVGVTWDDVSFVGAPIPLVA